MEDIPLLVERFIKKMNHLRGRAVSRVGTEAMALLLGHDYPGNIRELENIIEHAFVLCHAGEIGVAHLPAYLLRDKGEPGLDRSAMATIIRASEEEIILEALRQHGYNRLAAAEALGIHKSTLFRKLKKYNITLPEIDGRSGRKK
jgi:transcriptional regulator with PAS, ATPase and Fis domain